MATESISRGMTDPELIARHDELKRNSGWYDEDFKGTVETRAKQVKRRQQDVVSLVKKHWD